MSGVRVGTPGSEGTQGTTKWGDRAAERYDEAYARAYREHDETAQAGESRREAFHVRVLPS